MTGMSIDAAIALYLSHVKAEPELDEGGDYIDQYLSLDAPEAVNPTRAGTGSGASSETGASRPGAPMNVGRDTELSPPHWPVSLDSSGQGTASVRTGVTERSTPVDDAGSARACLDSLSEQLALEGLAA